jgi:hypothetical protein
MALYPHPPRLPDGSIDWARINKPYVPPAVPDNGEPLAKLRRRCEALYRKEGRRFPPAATRDHCLRTLEFERQRQAHFRVKGKRMPPGATFAECLFALAKRLDVYTGGCDPKSGRDPPDLLFGPWAELWKGVGESLITTQPEFWTLLDVSGRGRPPGAENKQLNSRAGKEALRQRRRRQKKRDKYSG